MRRGGRETKRRAAALAAWGIGLMTWGLAARGQVTPPRPPATRPGLQLPPAATLPPAPAANKGTAPNPAEIADAQQALAERLAGDAIDALQLYVPTEALWRRAAAGLEAAGRLNPAEPRYPRLLAEAWTELGDTERVIKALSDYRTVLRQQQQPEDQVAQVRLIELYVSRMQSNEQKISYLVDVVNKDTLAPEVRSYAAALAVPAVLERSVPQAVEMVRKAVALNPLNPQARQWEWDLVASRGTPAERVRSLLAMIRCNPAQPPLLAEIGRHLAAAGMSAEAADWLSRAAALSVRTNTPVGPEYAAEYVNQLYRIGQWEQADGVIASILAQQPDDVDGWFMRLALDREKGAGVIAYDQELAQAKRVLVGRARQAAQRVAGGPASRPAAGGGGDDFLDVTVRRLKGLDAAPAARNAFISAVADLAWFELYFDRRADEAKPWADVLAQLLPAGDVTLARIQGWLAVANGDLAVGRAKLAAARDVDPLAALGMVFLLHAEAAAGPATAPATGPAGGDKVAQADALGKRLLTENPTGVLGMLVASALKNRKLEPDVLPAAAAFRAELAQLPPGGWLRITEEDTPASGPGKFYLLVAQPVKLAYRLGEPMLARITLQNVTDYPIAVGPGGTIKPDLWIDGKVTLTENTVYPLAVYDKVANVLVLPPRTSATQIVRVNNGPMADALRERPAAAMNLFMTVMLNPQAAENGVFPGPGGQKRQFTKQFIRTGAPMFNDAQKRKVYDGLSGLSGERMTTADLLAAYVRQSRDPQPDSRLVSLAPELLEQLRRAREDAVPQVGAWATYHLAALTPDGREAFVTPLISSAQWETRFLGLLAAEQLDPAARKRIATALAKDADPQVQALARAEASLADTPPARRPPTAVRTGAMEPETRPAGTGPRTNPAATPPTPRPAAARPGIPPPPLPATRPAAAR